MNSIPEDRAVHESSHYGGSSSTWGRSGIRMGSSGLGLAPHSSVQFGHQHYRPEVAEEEEDLSDWENEINEDGELFYMVPVGQAKHQSESSGNRGNAPQSGEAQKSRKSGGKLSRLVRRRESKRDRAGVKTVQQGGESSDNDSSSTYGQIKTFETLFETTTTPGYQSMHAKSEVEDNGSSSSSGEMTEIHEIFIKFNAKQFKNQLPYFQMVMNPDNPRNRGMLLEVVLGIVPEKSTLRPEESSSLERSIYIAGLVDQGPAVRCRPALHVSDILRSMDGYHVTMDNVNTFILQKLSSLSSSCKIKLIVQRAKHRKSTKVDSPILTNSLSSKIDFLQLLSDDDPSSNVSKRQLRIPHFTIFVTRQFVSETSPETADILFQYPDVDVGGDVQQCRDVLVQVRGIFVTLNQLLVEILSLNTAADSCPDSLMISSLILGTDLIHVAYLKEGEDLIVVGVPGTQVTTATLSVKSDQLVKFLRFKFGTLSEAFTQKSAETKKILFWFFFELLQQEIEESSFVDPLKLQRQNKIEFEGEIGCSQWLRLPDEIKFQVDDSLVQLESAFFDDQDSDEFYELPREFSILGSVLFHKGLLVATHLPSEQLSDVFLFCKMAKLLKISEEQTLHRLIVWNEVFPSDKDDQAYRDKDSRHFLLVVGRDHQLLGVLLQTGGCTQLPSGVVRPDPFYVDQALNTLDHLVEMGIPLVCDKWLSLPDNPSVINVDSLYEHTDKRKDKKHQAASAGVVLCRTKLITHGSESISDVESEPSHDNSCSDLSEELKTAFRDEPDDEHPRDKDGSFSKKNSRSSGRTHDSDDDSSTWQLPRSGHRSQLSFSEAKVKGEVSSVDDSEIDHLVAYKVSQLSMSTENVIFHYIHLDTGEGVFIAPLSTRTSTMSTFHANLLNEFRTSCHIIHENFKLSLRCRQSIKTAGGRIWTNKNLVAVKEQAMLFHWKPDPSSVPLKPQQTYPVLSYWVCGRLFASGQECFVAYHESAPQVSVEIAFRLLYGTHI